MKLTGKGKKKVRKNDHRRGGQRKVYIDAVLNNTKRKKKEDI